MSSSARSALLLASLATIASGVGCTPIDGGAVEASWTIRTPDGRGSSCGCAEPAIARIRFEIVPRLADGSRGPDVCAGKPSCSFACDASGSNGATRFEIPPGDYEIALVPVGAAGLDLRESLPTRVRVPANPQARPVVHGQVTQLDVFLVEASCAAECGGDVPENICSR